MMHYYLQFTAGRCRHDKILLICMFPTPFPRLPASSYATVCLEAARWINNLSMSLKYYRNRVYLEAGISCMAMAVLRKKSNLEPKFTFSACLCVGTAVIWVISRIFSVQELIRNSCNKKMPLSHWTF